MTSQQVERSIANLARILKTIATVDDVEALREETRAQLDAIDQRLDDLEGITKSLAETPAKPALTVEPSNLGASEPGG